MVAPLDNPRRKNYNSFMPTSNQTIIALLAAIMLAGCSDLISALQYRETVRQNNQQLIQQNQQNLYNQQQLQYQRQQIMQQQQPTPKAPCYIVSSTGRKVC